MNKFLTTLMLFVLTVCAVNVVQAKPLASRVSAKVQSALATSDPLTAPNAYGTPLVIELARKGDLATFKQLAQTAPNKDFLNVRDKYNNNLFHVAKDARTVHFIAGLIRQADGATATQRISEMANQRNNLDETPLFAQINAGHPDTFQVLYPYSLLKEVNEEAKNHLARLQGSDPRIISQHKALYARKIRQLASANGRTLLQAAQDQIPYNPHMAPLAQEIAQLIPCLVEN